MTVREKWERTLTFIVQWDGEGWWGRCPQVSQFDGESHCKASVALMHIKRLVLMHDLA